MPVSDRYVSGDQGRSAAVAVIHDFEQVLRLGTGEGVAEPVIGPNVRADDQELGASERVEEVGIRTHRRGPGSRGGSLVNAPVSLSEAEQQLTLARMQNALASAAIDARRGDYESAHQSAGDFFTSVEHASALSPRHKKRECSRCLLYVTRSSPCLRVVIPLP